MPQSSASVAASRPIFTQLAWRFVIDPPEREPEGGRVPQVVLARDLLDAVRAPEHRVERDERERHELGEAAGALLKLAHDAHVLGQLPGLLDVAEHHRHGACARPQRGRPR